MRRDLLNQLLHDVHDVDMMMMSLDHLRHLLEGTPQRGQMRPNQLSSIHSQILRSFLHVVEEEAASLVEKDVHCHVCLDRIL